MDSRTKLGDKKLIIYGHNSRYVRMPFKIFENYYDKKYLDIHKKIIFNTINEKRVYEIFSVYTETKNWDYLDIEFPTRKSYFDHLNDLKNRSIHDIDVELSGEDEILIIQTCSTHKDYRNYKKKFLIIVAKRVN